MDRVKPTWWSYFIVAVIEGKLPLTWRVRYDAFAKAVEDRYVTHLEEVIRLRTQVDGLNTALRNERERYRNLRRDYTQKTQELAELKREHHR